MSNFENKNFNMPVATLAFPNPIDSVQPKGDFTMDIETELDLMTFANAPATSLVTPAKASGFQHGVPSGHYNCTIKDARHHIHQDGGHDVIKLSLTVDGGPYAGHPLKKYYNLKTRKSLDFYRREMEAIGFGITERSALGGHCASLIGKAISAQVADHPSGNQVIFLKRQKAQGQAVAINPDDLWK